jgi:protein-S-isoprenylcysteine O-methyltransferase Ste14
VNVESVKELSAVTPFDKKAVLEEELLASEEEFGQAYHDYVLKTRRFLPKLGR